MVSLLTSNSDDPSSIPAETDSFYSVNCFKRTKSEKETRDCQFKKSLVLFFLNIIILFCPLNYFVKSNYKK